MENDMQSLKQITEKLEWMDRLRHDCVEQTRTRSFRLLHFCLMHCMFLFDRWCLRRCGRLRFVSWNEYFKN